MMENKMPLFGFLGKNVIFDFLITVSRYENCAVKYFLITTTLITVSHWDLATTALVEANRFGTSPLLNRWVLRQKKKKAKYRNIEKPETSAAFLL